MSLTIASRFRERFGRSDPSSDSSADRLQSAGEIPHPAIVYDFVQPQVRDA